jgi:fused signal recognition particle receptor
MTSSAVRIAVEALAQVPAPAVGAETGPWMVLALAAGSALLLALVLWRWRQRTGRSVPPKALTSESPAAGALSPAQQAPRVQLPPTEVEARARAAAELERQRAEGLRAERRRLEAESKVAKAGAPTDAARASEDLARQLKAQEEDAKKAAYRAEKAAEAEQKERKKREREGDERLRLEAVQREQAEAERLAREADEAQRRSIDAEAGQTLATGLAKTRSEGFMARLNGLFGAPKAIDDRVLGELEEVLFSADIGVKTASALVGVARDRARAKELDSSEKIKGVIRREVERIVDLESNHGLGGGGPPHVIMVVGVNGAGKTTTIGKLAAKAVAQGKRVILAAGDTFRAAATEQLDVWAARAGAQLVKGKDEADPASVIFEAVKLAKEQGADLVIADTAGRLHTKANLMEELKKVKRVVDKALPGAPHEVLLVLDATNGQNAIMQARQFHEAVGVTAIALTKLDGTAKGGVIIGICDELQLPVTWVGVGEKVADLRAFDAKEFVAALFD